MPFRVSGRGFWEERTEAALAIDVPAVEVRDGVVSIDSGSRARPLTSYSARERSWPGLAWTRAVPGPWRRRGDTRTLVANDRESQSNPSGRVVGGDGTEGAARVSRLLCSARRHSACAAFDGYRGRSACPAVCCPFFCVAVGVAMPVDGASAASSGGRWRPLLEVPKIVDAVGSRTDGRLVLSTVRGLFLIRPGGRVEAFATGAGGYAASSGEPYIALAPERRLPATNPPSNATTSSRSTQTRGQESPGSRVRAALRVYSIFPREPSRRASPALFRTLRRRADPPNETTGRIYAFAPTGNVRLVVKSGLRAGGDIGVEGLGFVPAGLGSRSAAYFSDLGAPGAPTEGTNNLLVLRGQDLKRAGLRAGELVASTEAGAITISVRSARRCSVRHVADGRAGTHSEGHLTFVPG